MEEYNVFFNRIYIQYNVDDESFSGAIEGDFSSFKLRYFLKRNRDKFSEINFLVPCNGLLLFSTENVDEFARQTVSERQSLIDSFTCERLMSVDRAFFTTNTDALQYFGFDFGKSSLEKFDSILCLWTNDNANLEFVMKSENDALSLYKAIKANIATNLRKTGNKIDSDYLNKIISIQVNQVFLNNQKIKLDLTDIITNEIMEVM